MMDTILKSNTQKAKRVAYVYLRVSTDDQEQGNSIKFQKGLAKAYAAKFDFDEVLYVEEIKSASKIQDAGFNIASNLYKSLSNREELQNLVKLAQQKRFTDLIVYSRDRLARNLELFIALNFFFIKNGVTIHYTKPGEKLSSDNDRLSNFFSIVLGSIAELEANLISSRVKDGQIECIRSGIWAGGKPPHGYKLKKVGKKNHKLEPSDDNVNNIHEIFHLYSNCGFSYRKIADALNSKYADGQKPWTRNKIQSIITNPVYLGRMIWNRRSSSGYVDDQSHHIKSNYRKELELIDKAQWDNAVRLRYDKSTVKDPKYFNTPFLLRGKLICGHCLKPMKPKNYGKNSNGVDRGSIYRCDVKKGYTPHFIINKELIESIFLIKFATISSPQNIDTHWELYQVKAKKNIATKDAYLNNIKKQLSEIPTTIARIDRVMKNVEVEINTLEIEISELDGQLSKVQSDDEKRPLESQIKELKMQSKQEYTLMDAIQKEKTLQLNVQKYLLREMDELKTYNTYFFETKEEFANALEQFIQKDFISLDHIRKRIIIDLLVESITLTENKNGKHMEILLKKP